MAPSIEELMRAAAPRAPRGIAEAVARRLAARRRTRRALWTAAGAFVAAAALLMLWLAGRPLAPARHDTTWVAVRAERTTADGEALAVGRPLALGARVRVGDGGAARFERPSGDGTAAVELGANSEARVGDGALELSSGQARLEGPEARVTGDVAEVTTLAPGAAATVELRRNPMMTTAAPKLAALAALLTVTVHDGGARVVAQGHDPVLLAKNDRTMVAPKLPPLTTRATGPATAKRPTPTPAAKPTPTPTPNPTPTPTPAATPTAEPQSALDSDAIHQVVDRRINEFRFCYEQALAKNEKVAGRFTVRMQLVTQEGVGRVHEAEIVPADDGYLDAPSMQECVLRAVSRCTFPPTGSDEPLTVDFPFVFATGN